MVTTHQGMRGRGAIFAMVCAIMAVFMAVFTVVITTSCAKKPAGTAAGGTEETQLNVYNWTYYTPPSIIEKFEAEYGVQVIYDEYASNEDMYAKIQSGAAGYDLVFPSADYVSIMIKQGMFEKIDHAKLSTLGNIDPLIREKATYDSDMQYSVPYYWGAAGVTVNTEKVSDYEKSWNIFARSDLKGRMTMLDDMREVFGDALATMGASINETNQTKIKTAADIIQNKWKPNLVKFDAEAFGKGYAAGDFWVVQGYSEVVAQEIAADPELVKHTVFFIPEEGGPAYIDSMCILKGAPHPDLAHKFIDFIHRPEIYAEFVNYFGLPSTVNVPARQFVKGIPAYSVEDLARTTVKDDVGSALELYSTEWDNRIRIGE